MVAVLLEHLQAGVSDTLELLPKCLTLLAERGDVPGGDDDEAGRRGAAAQWARVLHRHAGPGEPSL